MLSTAKAAERSFSALYGKPCWGLRQGHGSFLLLEFGQPNLKIREPINVKTLSNGKLSSRAARRSVTVVGDWHLWIYCCDWEILSAGNEHLANNESKKREIAKALAAIDGEALQNFVVNTSRGSAAFHFDLGAKIKVTPYIDLDSEGEPYKSLMLFEPSGHVFTYRADGTYAYHQSDEPSLEWLGSKS